MSRKVAEAVRRHSVLVGFFSGCPCTAFPLPGHNTAPPVSSLGVMLFMSLVSTEKTPGLVCPLDCVHQRTGDDKRTLALVEHNA